MLLALLVLAGCTVAPVQEMSDARQALQAARAAGAADHSPGELAAAEELLHRAQRALEAGDYVQARDSALSARNAAVEAREQALKQRPSPPK